MPKPDKWNIAHSERERRKSLEMKMATPVKSGINFSELAEYVRQSDHFKSMQQVLTAGETGMGIGSATLGATISAGDISTYKHFPTSDGCTSAPTVTPSPTPEYYSPTTDSYISPDDHADSFIYIQQKEYDALGAEIKSLKLQLSERDEIIEAFAADAEYIDALHKDNERLKAGYLVPIVHVTAPKDGGWIEWDGGKCPVPPDTIVDVSIPGWDSERTHNMKAKTWDWGKGPGVETIMSYRISV